MLARILLLIIAASSSRTFILEKTREIVMAPGETVVLDHQPRPKSLNMWVIGRFPSHKIIPNEGRLGDRNTERTTDNGQMIQTWSITATGASAGDELHMDFWYLKPQYAEQYFNDPEAYEAVHNEKVETIDMVFKIVAPNSEL